MKVILSTLFILVVLCITPLLYSQIPHTISYQGLLTDSLGNAKADGQYNFTFRFYDNSNGGNAIWSENKKLQVKKGLFSTNLGDKNTFGKDVKFDKQYWLSVSVNNESELFPRIPLNSVGYSFSSINADTANYAKQFKLNDGFLVKSVNGLKDNITIKGGGGTTVTSIADTIIIGGSGSGILGIQSTDNNLSITNPNGPTATINLKVPFVLSGNADNPNYIITSTASGTGGGIQGISNNGFGVVGMATGKSGINYGMAGNSYSPDGFAVSGYNLSTSGFAVGVIGKTNSGLGIGVKGEGGNTGVSGSSVLSAGTGVSGSATSSSGINYGVYGSAESPDGYGVVGWNYATTGKAIGVRGATSSPGGDGVFGESTNGIGTVGVAYGTSGVNYGLAGNSYSPQGNAVSGYNLATTGRATGVLGTTNSKEGFAIYGINQQDGIAGFFHGDVSITGVLQATDKRFRIDYPLDPANKFLIHSCVESPDRTDIYNGNIITDANGRAVVQLPDYFEALNKDYRYQLTVIGQFAQAIVEKEISNNQFIIRTNVPNVKVSWQVTGIRNDAYAKANPITVVKEKALDEKGKYLNPEVFGQPKEKGIFYNEEAGAVLKNQ